MIERFDALEPGNVAVSNDQFATAVSDAELFEQLQKMTGIGHQLARLDLNDSSVIGSDLRKRSLERVADVEHLAKTCEELAVFDPRGPAAELRRVAADCGRYGARLTQVFIEILVAETISAARRAEAEMQSMLAGFPHGEWIDELLQEMEGWIVRDFDARAALVLEREGCYSDEYGFLDLGAVFSAYDDVESPMEELARCGRRYFSHLIGETSAGEMPESLLVLPAIGLATLDRPLTAHRIARALFTLMREVNETAPGPTAEVVGQTVSEGDLVFAAIERIRRGLIYLAAAEEKGLADEEGALKTTMDAYKELAETSFRTYGRLVLDLEAIKRGEEINGGNPPMLGELVQRLAASTEPAAKLLAAASDTALRNACSHAQYRWEEASEEVVDLRTEERWSLAELESATEALSAAIAGADAGYACFVMHGSIDLDAPAWVSSIGPLADVIVKVNFETRGFEVLEVRDGGLTVVIADETELEKLGLMATLGGLISIASEDDVLKVLGSSRGLLLEVDAQAFENAREADEKVKDLAILLPCYSNALRAEGTQPEQALVDWASVMVNQVLTTLDPDCGLAEKLRVGDRLGFVCDFLTAAEGVRGEESENLRRRLARCRGYTYAAARGDEDAWAQFAAEVLDLIEWVVGRGMVWPPRF